jgi:hypothetical protein
MNKILRFGIVLSVFIVSCESDTPLEPEMGFDYFPLKVGNFQIYEVVQTDIVNNVATESTYELRAVVSDSAKNNNGSITYTIIREKRVNPSADWQPFETWSAKLANNKLIQNESNILFVKLLFPPSLNLSWDGNEFNNLPDNGNLFNDSKSEKYIISDVSDITSLSNGYQVANTITVTQNAYNDIPTGKDQRSEIYAKNVGLVYKEIVQLKYCTIGSCLGQQFIEKGVILSQSIKSNGTL